MYILLIHSVSLNRSFYKRLFLPAYRLGDQIISVNGIDLEDVSHTDAVQTLKNSGKDVELVHLSSPIYTPSITPSCFFCSFIISLPPTLPLPNTVPCFPEDSKKNKGTMSAFGINAWAAA